MQLNRLVLRGWRNWRKCEAEFDGRLNVVWGNNGQGKTNLLEAIYYLTHLNSFRSSSKNELIAWEEDHCRLVGDLTAGAGFRSATITWTTDREIASAGFNILRSKNEAGPYAQVNKTLIESQGSSTAGAAYEYTDRFLRNRATYYYQLEAIDSDGQSTMYGPVSATPRLIYLFKK